MILIITSDDNKNTLSVLECLSQKDYKIIGIEKYPGNISSNFIINDEIKNLIGDINLREITSIYYCPYLFPVLPKSNMPDYYQNFLDRELLTLFLGQLMLLPKVFWINHPFFAHIASFKIMQLFQAKNIGFSIPETIISTDANSLFSFYRKVKSQNKEVISKAVYQGYIQGEKQSEDKLIFTQKVEIISFDQIPKNTPILLQEKIITEFEIRIIVVCDDVFPVKITTKNSYNDIRLINAETWLVEKFTLPEDIKNKCIEITKHNKLVYSAIDLLYSNGVYYFLEMNPMGNWQWYETKTGYKIGAKIAHLLKKNK